MQGAGSIAGAQVRERVAFVRGFWRNDFFGRVRTEMSIIVVIFFADWADLKVCFKLFGGGACEAAEEGAFARNLVLGMGPR